MEPTSRRQFLKRSSAVAAAAGAAAVVPATAAKALTSSSATHEPPLPDDSSVDVPVVAHVTNVRKGHVSLYTGEREFTIKDRRLAAALYRATH
jgi:anaerobic selenocysteine-containing dehydrogenase